MKGVRNQQFVVEEGSSAEVCSGSTGACDGRRNAGLLSRYRRRFFRLLLLALGIFLISVVLWIEMRYAVFRYIVQGEYSDDSIPKTKDNPRYRIQQSLQRQLFNFCTFLSMNYDRCEGDFDCFAALLPKRRRIWYRGRMRPIFERPLQTFRTNVPDRIDRTHCMTSNNLLSLSTEQLERVQQARHCPARKRYLWFVYVVRNEARLLVQNILHHLALGVDHFLVYDNDSSDNLEESLEPFRKVGLVSLYKISGQGVQLRAYDNALSKAKDANVSWLGAIDADEFLVSTRAVCIPSLLEQVYSKYNTSMAALGVNWRFPGRYTRMMNATSFPVENVAFAAGRPNKHIKSIVHVARTKNFVLPHNAEYDECCASRSVSGRLPAGPFLEPADAQDTALIHLYSKGATDWIQKRIRGRADISWAFMKSQPHIFFNDDIISIYMEWLAQRKAAPYPAHPLQTALQNHTIALKRALWGQ